MITKKGIGYSPLTEKVYLDKQNKEQRIWVGEKEDITSDFINVIFDYVPINSTRIIKSSNGDSNIFINVMFDKKGLNSVISYLQKQLETLNK